MMADTPPNESVPEGARANQLQFIVTVGTRRWRLIAVFTVVAMLVYGTAELLRNPTRPRYAATTDLMIKRSVWERGLLRRVAGMASPTVKPGALIKRVVPGLHEEVVQTIVQHDIADGGPWAQASSEAEYAVKTAEIKRFLTFTDDPEADLIHVKATGQTKEDARRLAEFGARVFVERARNLQIKDKEQAYTLITEKIGEIRDQLTEAERARWTFQKETGFRPQLTSQMSTLQKALADNQNNTRSIVAEMGEVETQLIRNNEQLPLALGQIADSVVDELFSELDGLLREKTLLQLRFEDEFGPLQDLNIYIDEKQDTIRRALRELDIGTVGGINVWEERRGLRSRYLGLQLQLAKEEFSQETLLARQQELINNLPELLNQERLFSDLVGKTDQLRKQFNALIETEFEIGTEIDRSTGQVERRNNVSAGMITGPTRQFRTWGNFLVGGIIGLLIGFGLATMLEMMDTSIRSVEDITQYVGLEVVGTIPKMRFGKPQRGRRRGIYVDTDSEEQVDACIVTQHDPKSPISEAYRALRTNFQFATIQLKPRSVMVTSAVPGEGKTTTAVNLAVTMADRGMRVLLVDTDLRRPNAHRFLKMERGPGLAEILRAGTHFESVVRPTQIENLSIITSGRVPPNPSELIGSDRMKRFIDQVSREFDLVVCDAPSILVVTDPVLLATHTDTVLIVAAANNARRETILRAKKLLASANAHVAGVVLNGLEATRRHYYYYYYYYDDDDSARRSHRRWYHA